MTRFPLILAAFLLCACAPVPARAEAIPVVTSQPQQVTIYETPQPTIGYMATVDGYATQAAHDREAALQAQQNLLDARATVDAAAIAQAQITQSAEQLIATTTAEAYRHIEIMQAGNATQSAFVVAATATGARAAVEQSNAHAELLRNQSINTRANTEAKTAAGNMIIVAILSVAVIIFLLIVWRGVYNYGKPEAPEYDVNEAMGPPQQISTT